MSAEGDAARSWVQGITYGRVHGFQGLRLTQEMGPDGGYLPWFDVELADGTVVRVSFEVLIEGLILSRPGNAT